MRESAKVDMNVGSAHLQLAAGKTEELTPNRALKDNNGRTYDIIFGDFLVTGLTEENFGSLSDELIEKYIKFFYF